MPGRPGRKLLAGAVVATAVAVVVRTLRGDPAPAFSRHPSVDGGLRVTLATPPVEAPEPTPDEPDLVEAEPAAIVEALLLPVADVAADEPPSASSATTWVEPVDGACPAGYPVKAKLKSGIFHLPGGLAYERTKPDRCYPDAAAAEADGLRAAKR